MRKPIDQFRVSIFCLAAAFLPVYPAFGQALDSGLNLVDFSANDTIRSESLFTPTISVQRNILTAEQQSLFTNDALNINLGLVINPVNGLNMRADAWRLEQHENPANALIGPNLSTTLPDLLIEPMAQIDAGVGSSLLASGIRTNGIDLGASYIFETNKAGQFTLSTKATYIYDFRQGPAMLEANPLATTELPGTADLQGSLTLSWDFGNHSASATTNYFDSFKDLSELNLEEINKLVEDIVTFDLQYGYSIKTGMLERAEFSFGIRNIFDKKTTQILNNNNRVVDQNGRVAYGSIKYQF
ncbi:MAG: hypothetical protein WD772_08915 [Pseudohongiellaceae bacterium]